jgi:hypothetical protein
MMGYSHGFIEIGGEMVDVARNYLIEQVLESGAKYLFFVGDDTVIPWDGFDILHKTAEANPGAVVAGVYYIKCSNAMIHVRTPDNHITVANVDPGQIIDSWQTGMDAMLIPIDILRRMKEEEPELPFCCIANEIEDIPFIGEDNFFVYRLRKMGVKVLTNTDVQCLHMDLESGKYTAHPSVDLTNYYTNIKPTGVLTRQDKTYIDHRWISRLPGGINNPKTKIDKWLPAQGIPDLIKDVENPIGLEIGTDEGLSTEYLLAAREDLKLYGVDPYIDTDGDNSGSAFRARKVFMKRTEPFGERYTHILKTSDDAVEDFFDESMDFIFIDGRHTYEQVKKDCENYWRKLKVGGVYSGHDYMAIPEVNRAVNEFAASVAKDVNTTTQDVWYIIK